MLPALFAPRPRVGPGRLVFDFQRPRGADNAELIREMKESGAFKSSEVEAAFLAVDRGQFVPRDAIDSAYEDGPLRCRNFHLSQPSLYSDAVHALDLKPGVSVLNVGCGTGYLSCIISEITGPSIHHGVDVHEEVLEHARGMFVKLKKPFIKFFRVNALDLDLEHSMLYDRIYLGACAGGDAKRLLDLLAVGGVLVGPFETSQGQFFRRAQRRSETEFEVENLKGVQFATLKCPTSGSPKFVLPYPAWTPETSSRHPQHFIAALRSVLTCTYRPGCSAGLLPRDIWISQVFGFVHPRWFDQPLGDTRVEILEDGTQRPMGAEGEVDRARHARETLELLARHGLLVFGRAPAAPGDAGNDAGLFAARAAEEGSEEDSEDQNSGEEATSSRDEGHSEEDSDVHGAEAPITAP